MNWLVVQAQWTRYRTAIAQAFPLIEQTRLTHPPVNTSAFVDALATDHDLTPAEVREMLEDIMWQIVANRDDAPQASDVTHKIVASS